MVQMEIATAHGLQSMRISCIDQRLTALARMVVWSRFLHQSELRTQLAKVLTHAPKNNHAYDPADVALGFRGGILNGGGGQAVAHRLPKPEFAPPASARHRDDAKPADALTLPRGATPEHERWPRRVAPLSRAAAAERA